MKQIFAILGACAFVASGPALAKSEHAHGHGKGHSSHSSHGAMSHGKHAKHSKHSKARMYGYSARGCPPGLSRHEGYCMPRGQFKRMYRSGQRYPTQYGSQWSYNQIPQDLRGQYGFNQNSRYYYGDGYIYQVDPRTMLIQQVVNAIMR